ncbi:major capsid protein, partial [bacterium]|nr:major capsid protein [bacterium]
MALPLQQSRNLFTKAYMKAFKESIAVASFFRSFFTTKTYSTKTVAIEVQRGTERISVDVLRGVDGQRNSFSLSTEKEYMPPFHNEYFDATSLDRYDVGFNQAINPATIGYLASDVAEKFVELRKKIERAKELQCAQVFATGIVTMTNGDNIDFKRQAGSKVDLTGAGGYWTTTTTDIESQLIAAGNFMRQVGKNAGKVLNLTMSGDLWVNFKLNDFFTTNAAYNQVKL